MVTTNQILAFLPHYVAMVVLAFAGVTVVRLVLGRVPVLVGLVVVLGIVFLYPFVMRSLGYAPEFWE